MENVYVLKILNYTRPSVVLDIMFASIFRWNVVPSNTSVGLKQLFREIRMTPVKKLIVFQNELQTRLIPSHESGSLSKLVVLIPGGYGC
ncbi:hypothetical protein J6590_032990 [Homalodisca vitripennis]|nr:hypothetical protein J6590_032990 [Homalodisca vitripennis]